MKDVLLTRFTDDINALSTGGHAKRGGIKWMKME